MAHPKPYPRCIFCEAKADSREHAIPAWVGKRLGIRKEELRMVLARDAAPRRKQPIVFGSHRERIFCSSCNKHFKALEDEAIPLVEWMARGRSLRLGPAEQDLLGLWGAKTGFALLAAASDEFGKAVPLEHRKQLRFSGTVHPHTWVGYGSWSGYINRVATTDVLEAPEQGTAPQSYLVILTFAQLALQVFGVDELPPGRALGLNHRNLKQVSPRSTREIAWPTSPSLGDPDIQKFVGSLPYKLC